MIGPEAPQRSLASEDGAFARGVFGQDLADQEHLVAPVGDGVPNQLLRSTVPVHLGRVDPQHHQTADLIQSHQLLGDAQVVPAVAGDHLGGHQLLDRRAPSELLGWHPKLGVAALVLFYLPVTFMMHPFWRVPDPMMRLADVVNFSKNLALMGSALMLLANPEPWPVSLDTRLRLRTPRTA